ncbi:exported hypothetical protein [metagenome]|uniref:Extracellular solute-binding protein n=1 Tax=metagenome TaxID=256318 RepID=A0A2P2C8Z6_9ZZZZ
MRNLRSPSLTKGIAITACISALLALAACGGDTSAASKGVSEVGTDIDAICEAGKSEPPLVRWAGGGQASVWDEYIGPFTDAYGIQVSTTDLGGEGAVAPRLLAEQQAGRDFSANIFDQEYVQVVPILNSDYVSTVDWTEFGFPASQLSQDETHLGIRITRAAVGIAYNPEKFSEEEIPDTYEELIDPKWKGRINVDPTGEYFALLGLGGAMGLEDAIDWYDRFKEVVDPVPIQGSTSSLQAVASGQIDISTNATYHNVQAQIDEGVPLAIKYLDIVQMNDQYGFIVANNPSPNASVCFMNWWAGEEGEKQRIDIEYKANADVPEGAPEGAKAVNVASETDIALVEGLADHIKESLEE